jgi:tetratricopeptide (TPR) repeat protein
MKTSAKIFLNFLPVLCAVVWTGCGASKSEQYEEPVKIQASALDRALSERNRDLALTRFIDGSLKESKGEYAEAILEYQDALRYDRDPAIFYALAKNYSILRKHDLAAQNGLEAVRMDSTNLTYRETLAGIYVNAGKLDDAAGQFSKIVALDSSHTASMYALAQITERKNPAEALKLYNDILRRSGPSWEVLLRVGELSAGLQRFDTAVEAFKQLLKLDPDNVMVKRSIAEFYFNAGKFDSAKALYGELSAKDPNDLDLHGALAEVYIRQGAWPKAEKEFQTILGADSVSADTRFKIASAYYLQAQKDSTLIPRTIEQFNDFLKQYPNDWRPLLYLGVLKRLVKDYPSAQRYLEQAVNRASWNAEAWWQLGWFYFEQDKIPDAIATMERARQVLPNEFRVHLLLGIAYSRAQRNMDAIVALERAVELEPEDVNALSSLGLAYDAMKNFLKSDSTYERALKIDPHYSLVLNNYAYSLSERGIHLERALAMSKEAVSKDSLNASYLDTFGWVLFKLGDYSGAEKFIRKAIAAGDGSATVLEHLGDVYAKMKRMESAVMYWKKAFELDGSNLPLKKKIEQGVL